MRFESIEEAGKFADKVRKHETWEALAREVKADEKEVRWAVYSLRSKYGAGFCPLLKKKSRLDAIKKSVEMRANGKRSYEIADKLGISRSSVCHYVRQELGPNWKGKVPRHLSSEDMTRTAKIMSMRKTHTAAAIGRLFGLTRQRVHQIVVREMERKKMKGVPFPRGRR